MNAIRLLPPVLGLLLAACASAPSGPGAAFPPPPAVRVNGYEGPMAPESEVATVFLVDGRPNYESGYVCMINDRPATAQGGCASIVYLKPGLHRLHVRYQSRLEVGQGEIRVNVEAGRLYQLNATSFRTQNSGMLSVIPMATARLTYRNVAPGQFSGAKADQPVPYDAPAQR